MNALTEGRNQFLEISNDLKKYCEDNEINLGYTDTPFGQLAMYIQDKVKSLIEAELARALREQLDALRLEVDKAINSHITNDMRVGLGIARGIIRKHALALDGQTNVETR